MSRERPSSVDLGDNDYPVTYDPDAEHLGIVRWDMDPPTIVLREYDEQVLLHEVLHILLRTAGVGSFDHEGSFFVDFKSEERIVQRITEGLLAMGWRPSSPREVKLPNGNYGFVPGRFSSLSLAELNGLIPVLEGLPDHLANSTAAKDTLPELEAEYERRRAD